MPEGFSMPAGNQDISKTFCILAWTNFHTSPDGTVQMCCISHEPIRKEDGRPYNFRRDDPAEIWNSPDYKGIRQALVDGTEIKHCRACYNNERLGISSHRKYTNSVHGYGLFLDRLVDTSDPVTVKSPVLFDVRLGNYCNLKCRMCWPEYSSQIERDPIAAKWTGENQEPIGTDVSAWPEAVNLMEKLKAFSDEAIQIELIGGEPTLNKSQLELLGYFVDKGNSNKIQLVVISNLTNAKEHAYRLFSQFKSPSIHVSLEGVGRTLEYIR